MQHNTYKAEPGVQGGIAPTVPPKIRPVPSLLLYNNNPKILILVIDSQQTNPQSQSHIFFFTILLCMKSYLLLSS